MKVMQESYMYIMYVERINFYWKITSITQQPIQNAWDC